MQSTAQFQRKLSIPSHSGSGQNVSGNNTPPGLTLVESDPGSTQVVGISASWRKLLTQAEMAAPHVQVATIEGEHGTGKHTLARYLYSHSGLGAARFERRDAREWLATDADPSTLVGFTYLDRVDLLAPPGQGLLLGVLRALQDRVPGRAPGRAVLLASSETSLRQLAGQGLLLPDLAFRLTAIRFAVPALRMRREDIAPLSQCLLDRLCARYQQRPVTLGPGALARLLQHNWPGNVRELASVLETALLEAENGVIRAADLAIPDGSQPAFAALPGSTVNPSMHSNFNSGPAPNFASPYGAHSSHGGPTPHGSHPIDSGTDAQAPAAGNNLSLDTMIRQHVQYVLDLNRGNKLRAARQLAISRSTLYRILTNESCLAR